MIKSPTKKQWSILALVCALLACMVFATYVVAFENITPTKLTFTPGYREMTVSWDTYTSNLATTTSLYAVYRANDATGKGAHRIAVLDGEATSYTDANVMPGQNYYYAVINGQGRDGLTNVNTSELVWSAAQLTPLIGGKDEYGNKHLSPHVGNKRLGVAARNQKSCKNCHVIHDSAASATNLITTNQNSDEPNSAIALCEKCHMDTTAVEKNFVARGLTATSGHTIKNRMNPNGVLECSTCHGAHQDSAGSKGSLITSTFKKFGTLTEDIKIDPTEQNASCIGCHDDNNTWYTATHEDAYPSTANPTKLTNQPPTTGLNGYPEKGTFPGATVAESTTQNVHANIPAFATFDKGDCRYCHSSHANGAPDQLRTAKGELRAMKTTGGVVSEEELTSGAYASFCLSCHNDSNSDTPWSGATDMKSYIALEPGSTEASRTAFLNSNAGHRISSPNADYAQGSALPCYTCHNPHGSATNELNFSDELGTNLKKNDDMCYTCHVTSDGYVCEDGNDGVVVPLADAKNQTVVGLNRNGSDGSDKNKLKLSDIDAHQKGSTQACSTCHGDPHRPNTQ